MSKEKTPKKSTPFDSIDDNEYLNDLNNMMNPKKMSSPPLPFGSHNDEFYEEELNNMKPYEKKKSSIIKPSEKKSLSALPFSHNDEFYEEELNNMKPQKLPKSSTLPPFGSHDNKFYEDELNNMKPLELQNPASSLLGFDTLNKRQTLGGIEEIKNPPAFVIRKDTLRMKKKKVIKSKKKTRKHKKSFSQNQRKVKKNRKYKPVSIYYNHTGKKLPKFKEPYRKPSKIKMLQYFPDLLRFVEKHVQESKKRRKIAPARLTKKNNPYLAHLRQR